MSGHVSAKDRRRTFLKDGTMTYRHFLGAGALAVAVSLAITGCANQKTVKPSAEEPQAEPTERYSQLAQTDDGPTTQPLAHHTDLNLGSGSNTQDILAQKTAAYAEEVERLLKARAAEKAAGAGVAPTTRPAAAKSEVTFVEPSKLPPAQNPAAAKAQSVAKGPAAPEEKKPTIHELLDTAPAAANQATKIPVGNEQVAVPATPAVDVKTAPPQPQGLRQQAPDLAMSSDELARKLGERIKSDPLDVAAHLDYQLLQMLNGESVPELNAIASLPQEDREIISAIMDGLSNFRSNIRGGANGLLKDKTGPIAEMGDRVRNQATLSIPSLKICRDVTQYGVYEPFTSTRFVQGDKHLMVVYCEVQNFASQLNSKGLWETKLKYEVLLYTDSNDAALQVWQQKATPVVDQCHSRRRDFFIAKLMELPQDLPVGGYLMKVSIVDEMANRIAEATVPLQIVAK
jgi:hypothetical protein